MMPDGPVRDCRLLFWRVRRVNYLVLGCQDSSTTNAGLFLTGFLERRSTSLMLPLLPKEAVDYYTKYRDDEDVIADLIILGRFFKIPSLPLIPSLPPNEPQETPSVPMSQPPRNYSKCEKSLTAPPPRTPSPPRRPALMLPVPPKPPPAPRKRRNERSFISPKPSPSLLPRANPSPSPSFNDDLDNPSLDSPTSPSGRPRTEVRDSISVRFTPPPDVYPIFVHE
jgi:hypothetical protein